MLGVWGGDWQGWGESRGWWWVICTIIEMMWWHISREGGLISVMGGARVGLSCRQSVTAPTATSPPDTYAKSHQILMGEPPKSPELKDKTLVNMRHKFPINHRTKSHHQSTRYSCQEPPVHQQPSATGSPGPKDMTPAIQPPSVARPASTFSN